MSYDLLHRGRGIAPNFFADVANCPFMIVPCIVDQCYYVIMTYCASRIDTTRPIQNIYNFYLLQFLILKNG